MKWIKAGNKYKWKTVVALLGTVVAVYYNVNWFWSIIIFLGLVHIIRSRQLHFVEVIKRDETPHLYWVMVGLLFILGTYSILEYLA